MTLHTPSSQSASAGKKKGSNRIKGPRPYHTTYDTFGVAPSKRATKECGVCFWSHPDLQKGHNYYHSSCLKMLEHEFHNPPEDLVAFNRSKV